MERFRQNEPLRKAEIVAEFGVSDKSFERDIADLRAYLAEMRSGEIVYDRERGEYRLLNSTVGGLTERDVFALSKILIESRAFAEPEFNALVEKLLQTVSTDARRDVEKRIAKERVYYLPLRHGKPLIERLWELSNMVSEQKVIAITYVRQDGVRREHRIMPIEIMFSEFYFYLIAYMADERHESFTVFRVDRIERVEPTDERFQIPHADRFNETQFRRRVQFMYPGELKFVRFIYRGPNAEAVLDRLPTAQILEERDGGVLISAEVYGKGVDMWLRSQGDLISEI
jgi:predicted DNA-binding transcriptional regulator YafY